MKFASCHMLFGICVVFFPNQILVVVRVIDVHLCCVFGPFRFDCCLQWSFLEDGKLLIGSL